MLQASLDQKSHEPTPEMVACPCEAEIKNGLESFTALPSNIAALEAVMRFIEGTAKFVAIAGPSGWGKSHLLDAVCEQVGTCSGEKVGRVSAIQWAKATSRQDLSSCLVLDDLQDLLAHPRARHLARQSIDYRVRAGKRTLVAVTTDCVSSSPKAVLPFGSEWTMASLGCPNVDERQLVVYQIASESNLLLGRATARLIARHLNGNGRSIRGAIQRLKLVKSDWSSSTDVIGACGALAPYLLAHDGWDPRDQAHEAVLRTMRSSQEALTPLQVSSYFMLHEMGLCEQEVASFLKVTPSRAYRDCARVRSRLGDAEVQRLINACRIAVLCGFEEG